MRLQVGAYLLGRVAHHMRRFNALMQTNSELDQFNLQVTTLTAIQKIWDAVVPQNFRPFCRAGGVKHRRITVYADNGTVAAKLKLLAPSLLIHLQKQGVEVTSIRVEVQVKSTARSKPKVMRNLSSTASNSLSTLAKTLPDSPLRSALERLASHQKNR